MQLDLFTQAHDMPLSERHPHNPRAFHHDTVRREVWEGKHCRLLPSGNFATYVEIKVARDSAGYHWTTGYQGPDQHSGGPVFAMRDPAPTLALARAQAIEAIRSRKWPAALAKIVELIK
jgi:hypothetical protein